jgi:hypothetical protein
MSAQNNYDFIHHIYGQLKPNLQHMVSFDERYTIPGVSGRKKIFNKKTIPMIFFCHHQCVRKFVYEDQTLFITELSEICSKGFNCAARKSESSIQKTQEILQKYIIVI